MGKGSRARPFEVDQDKFASNWELAFGKKDKEKDIKEESLEKKSTEKTESETDK